LENPAQDSDEDSVVDPDPDAHYCALTSRNGYKWFSQQSQSPNQLVQNWVNVLESFFFGHLNPTEVSFT
jgi:hypothetical protein